MLDKNRNHVNKFFRYKNIKSSETTTEVFDSQLVKLIINFNYDTRRNYMQIFNEHSQTDE